MRRGSCWARPCRRETRGMGSGWLAGWLGWGGAGWGGLGWAGLGWAGLGWAGLGWAGLGGVGWGWGWGWGGVAGFRFPFGKYQQSEPGEVSMSLLRITQSKIRSLEKIARKELDHFLGFYD